MYHCCSDYKHQRVISWEQGAGQTNDITQDMCVCVCVGVSVCKCVYCVGLHVCVSVCICVDLRQSMCVCPNLCECACVCECVCVCVCEILTSPSSLPPLHHSKAAERPRKNCSAVSLSSDSSVFN